MEEINPEKNNNENLSLNYINLLNNKRFFPLFINYRNRTNFRKYFFKKYSFKSRRHRNKTK